jgi:hypothetical protein
MTWSYQDIETEGPAGDENGPKVILFYYLKTFFSSSFFSYEEKSVVNTSPKEETLSSLVSIYVGYAKLNVGCQ